MWLGALVSRVMHSGGWASAARFAGAEPLFTGHTRVYDESTLRHAADQLDAEGCSGRVASTMLLGVTRRTKLRTVLGPPA